SAEALHARLKTPLLGVLPTDSAGTPGTGYTTSRAHDSLLLCPTLSVAVTVTVLGPALLVSIATAPLGSTARPDSASEATAVALALLFSRTGSAGQVTLTLGAVASTCTDCEVCPEVFPALSLTVALSVNLPL